MASSIVNFGWLFYHAITDTKTVQLDNNCMAINGKIYTGYAIKKVSRDQSFTATKSKETRNKILAQKNTKDSGMR